MADQHDIVEALQNRSSFYRMLAGFYFKPLTQEQIDTMMHARLSEFDINDADMKQGFHDMERYLAKHRVGARGYLAVDYTSIFYGSHAFNGKTAVPYESVHSSRQELMNQESRQKVYTGYKKQALKLKGATDTPDDHISFELEYMAILSDRAARALAEGCYEEALRNLVVQNLFLNEHLLSWFPVFQETAAHIAETRFYRGVLRVTSAFLNLDEELIGEMIDELCAQSGLRADDRALEPSAEWIARYDREGTERDTAGQGPSTSLNLW